MPIGFPLQRSPRHTDSTGRQDDSDSLSLDAVDYSNPAQVSAAFAAITRMRELESFVSWGFLDLNKSEALAAIAHTALCERATLWQQNNPGQQAIQVLVDGAKQQARAKFLSLLSPQGLAAVMEQYSAGRCEELSYGVRFVPNTGCTDVDALLAEVLPHAEAAARLREWGDIRRVENMKTPAAVTAAPACADVIPAQQADHPEVSKSEAITAALEPATQAMEARVGEARFWEGAAAYWEGANEPANEAIVWGRAAKAWHAAGQVERAAEAFEQQATACERDAWRADESTELRAEAWRKAADAWDSAAAAWSADGQPELATEALEMQAKAWLACGQLSRAADVWVQVAAASREVGDEVRAAAALEQEAAARDAVQGGRGNELPSKKV